MKNKFARNLGILGIIGILIKIIGALYRVPLAVFMTEDAVAYYSLAYPWYNMLIVLSSAAIPAVIAKLTAEAVANDDISSGLDVLSVAKMLMNFFGLFTALFLIGFAKIISGALGFPESTYSFYVLGVASYFVAINASYRGFFQGEQRLQIYGVSQLIEQIGRVTFGLALVVIFAGLSLGDSMLAAAGTSGAAFGALSSWAYVVVKFRKFHPGGKHKVKDVRAVMKKIGKLVLPLAMGASIMPLLSMIDGVLVIWRLGQIGYAAESAIMYSFVSFYSAPIINLSQVVFSALQVSLLPMVTKSFTRRSPELSHQIQFGILLSVLLGLPMGLGIAAFSEQILLFLYPSKVDVAMGAASVLSILGLSIVFLSLYLATTSILQGLNEYKRPVRHLLIGAIVKVIAAYVLIGTPSININGAAISTLLAYAVAAVLNLWRVYSIQPPDYQTMKKIGLTLLSNALMIISATSLFGRLEGTLPMRLNLLVSIFAAVLVYVVSIYLFKVIIKQDFENLGQS